MNEFPIIASQVLAFGATRIFPQCSLLGGGKHSLGFYYDFLFKQPFNQVTTEVLEVELHRLIQEGYPIQFLSMMRENAQSLFAHHGHNLLSQECRRQPSNILDLVQIDHFFGLCPPTSCESTSQLGYIKILDVSTYSALIDKEEVQVTRIIGIQSSYAKEIKSFIKNYHYFLKKEDHRLQGVQRHLFHFTQKEPQEPESVVWQPKGVLLRELLHDWFLQNSGQRDRQISILVQYRSSMTPQHIDYLTSSAMNINDFQSSVTESATLFSRLPFLQQWGILSQEHRFSIQTTARCKEENVRAQLAQFMQTSAALASTFDFPLQWVLIGSQRTNQSQQQQRQILKEAFTLFSKDSFSFAVEKQEEDIINLSLELRTTDVLGRSWTLSSLQVLSVKSDSKTFIVVCKMCESLDRWIALLLEKGEGRFPFWLEPEQIRIVVIGKANEEYAQEIVKKLTSFGFRVAFDPSKGNVNEQVLQAEKERVPYIVFIGEKERARKSLTIRQTAIKRESVLVSIEEFLKELESKSGNTSLL